MIDGIYKIFFNLGDKQEVSNEEPIYEIGKHQCFKT